MGSSQQILQATMVAVLSNHPTVPQFTTISARAMHLQSRQRARLTRKGQGWSKMACRVANSKGSSGSFKLERERGYPSYEKIQLSNWLHSISIIMMDTLPPRGFQHVGFTSMCSSLQFPLDDWDFISKRLACCCGVCSDSTLELLSMASRGTIFLRSCSSLMLMASAMEMRFDLRIIDARVLFPTGMRRLEASRKTRTSLSDPSKDSWLR